MQQLADFQFVEIISDKVDSTSLSEHLPFQSELNLNQRNKKRGEQSLRRNGVAYAKISIGSGMVFEGAFACTDVFRGAWAFQYSYSSRLSVTCIFAFF